MVARLEVELAGACRRSRAPRSRPRRRPAPRRRPGWGSTRALPCHSCSAAACAASASFTSAESVLVCASSACFSSPCACGISLPSCFCSARLASKSAIASRRAVSAARARSTTSSDSPRLAWAARTRSGSSRRIRGSIMVQRLSAGRTGPHPSSRTPFAILARCNLHRHRHRKEPLARPFARQCSSRLASVCFGLFAAAGIGVEPGVGLAGRPRRPRPSRAREWAIDDAWLRHPLRWRRDRLLGTVGLGVLLAGSRHPALVAQRTAAPRRTSCWSWPRPTARSACSRWSSTATAPTGR